jgi:myo-inositol-1(or 4)-monophosphatase
MPAFSPYATTALNAASAAAEIHRAWFGRLVRVEYKGRNDPVTVADRDAEAAIVSILRDAFSGHAFLGEETGRHGEAPYTWLIDPLDGTYNYARAIPWFAASIALEHAGRPIAGVILHTMLEEVYVAEAGRGAFAAGLRDLPPGPPAWGDLERWRPLHVTQTSRLDEATLGTGFPHDVSETGVNLDHFANLVRAAARTRAMGSAALALAAVALGQTEGYWEIGPTAWDFAAGALIVEEAGGRVSDLGGRRLDTYGRQILATNGFIHDQVCTVLARGRSGLG